MVAYKKKIVAFLVAVALCSGAILVGSARLAADESAEESAKPLFDNSGSVFAGDPQTRKMAFGNPGNDANLSVGSSPGLNTQELFFKMMLAVLLVVVFGVGAIYLSKKFLPRITNLSGKRIRVVETVHLGPRKTVHLLKIDNQQLLIGSTGESITKLADITDSLSEMGFSMTEIDNN